MALTLDAVLDASVEILDEYGLADLTMRRVADVLGVRAGALYHHVANKQTLLAAVGDRLLAEVPDPGLHADGGAEPTGGDAWRDALTRWARDLRTALLPHRDGAEIVSTARAMGLSRRDVTAEPSRALRALGLPAGDAAAAAGTLLHFALGHLAEEQARADWERFARPDAPAPPAADAGSYALGVDLILDGIAARLDTTGRKGAHPRLGTVPPAARTATG